MGAQCMCNFWSKLLSHTDNPVFALMYFLLRKYNPTMREQMIVSGRNSFGVPGHCLAGPTEALCFHLVIKLPYRHVYAYPHTCIHIHQHT